MPINFNSFFASQISISFLPCYTAVASCSYSSHGSDRPQHTVRRTHTFHRLDTAFLGFWVRMRLFWVRIVDYQGVGFLETERLFQFCSFSFHFQRVRGSYTHCSVVFSHHKSIGTVLENFEKSLWRIVLVILICAFKIERKPWKHIKKNCSSKKCDFSMVVFAPPGSAPERQQIPFLLFSRKTLETFNDQSQPNGRETVPCFIVARELAFGGDAGRSTRGLPTANVATTTGRQDLNL